MPTSPLCRDLVGRKVKTRVNIHSTADFIAAGSLVAIIHTYRGRFWVRDEKGRVISHVARGDLVIGDEP